MGTGTSVAKEASDITLLDDSFNSIGTAVMWGRSLYKNIQRFIVFQLTINFVALLIVLLGSVIGTELPLTVTQMLWVNLIMDTFAALALASIPPSETVMLEKPRRSTDFIISKAMQSNILGVGSIFLIVLLGMIYYFDHSTEGMDIHNLTIFFTFFVMLQFWNLFNARVFRHYRFGIQGTFQIVWYGTYCIGYSCRTIPDRTVRWSCIPYGAAQLANPASYYRRFVHGVMGWRTYSPCSTYYSQKQK